MGWNATKLPKSLERVDIPGDFLNLIVETNTVGFSPDQVGIINLSYDEGWGGRRHGFREYFGAEVSAVAHA